MECLQSTEHWWCANSSLALSNVGTVQRIRHKRNKALDNLVHHRPKLLKHRRISHLFIQLIMENRWFKLAVLWLGRPNWQWLFTQSAWINLVCKRWCFLWVYNTSNKPLRMGLILKSRYYQCCLSAKLASTSWINNIQSVRLNLLGGTIWQ